MSTLETSGTPGGGLTVERSSAFAATSEAGADEPDVLILPPSVERELSDTDESLGVLGRPLDRRNPFFIGLTGALGVAVAYLLFRGLADVASVLVIVDWRCSSPSD